MSRISEKYKPYAPVGNVLAIIRRLRESGLPDTIDLNAVIRVGVSEGNGSRTIAALQYLGLIDEEGKHTELMAALERASRDEYPGVLAEILRKSYSDIFKIVDPKTSTEPIIDDAFRGFDPSRQRDRMVSLFIGLCQEAGLREGEPSISEQPARSENREPIKRKDPKPNQVGAKIEFGELSKQPGYNARKWFDKLEVVLESLPDIESPSWTLQDKELWLGALTSLLNLFIKEED
jgi:hypothetical protein